MLLKSRLLILPAAASLLACASLPRPADVPNPESLLQAQSSQAQLSSLRGELRGEYWGKERVRFTASFLAVRPSRLRIEVEGPMGGALSSLASDGTQFGLLDVRENRFLFGPATPCNVGRLLQVELPVDDLVALLLGEIPHHGKITRREWLGRERHEVVWLNGRDGQSEAIHFASQNGMWRAVLWRVEDSGGKLLWSAAVEYRQDGDKALPAQLILQQPSRKLRLSLVFRDLEPNVVVGDDLFHLPVPAGINPELSICK